MYANLFRPMTLGIQDSLVFLIPATEFHPFCQWNWDSGFQSLVGFRILWAVFQIPKPSLPDSGIQIPIYGAIDHFTNTAAVLNSLDLRSIMGCPWGHEDDPVYLHQYLRVLFGPIFLKFSWKKIVIGTKDCRAMFGCNNDLLFPKKYKLKLSFCLKSAGKYRASAPWASHNTP